MIIAVRIAALGLLLLAPVGLSVSWVKAASERVEEPGATDGVTDGAPAVAVAAAADEDYCTPDLKRVLRRVLQSCGLLGSGSARGCQPLDARNVATMSGDDFNALFLPMRDRAGIIQFEQGEADLDGQASGLIDDLFADRRGASYFFVVARASPEGSMKINRELSKRRANIVMDHLNETFADASLEREVGMLWLGKEFAQLDLGFCDWRRSGDPDDCRPEHINRSAFIAWIDCRL